MKKWFVLLLVSLLALPALCSAQSYEATAAGFGGEINVVLDVEEGKIVGAQITGEGETPAIGGAALETLQNQLVEAGSAEIDGVAGATVTSDAVKTAAALALAPGERRNRDCDAGGRHVHRRELRF